MLGGPPGVGKSAVLGALSALDRRIGTVDADDVTPPDSNTPRATAIARVGDAVQQRFDDGYAAVVLAWVFARAQLYAPFEARFEGLTRRAYLVADQSVLKRRLVERGDPEKWAYSRDRLALIEALAAEDPDLLVIDTTNSTASEVAAQVRAVIRD